METTQAADTLYAEVDASDNSTTVTTSPALLIGAWVTTVLSAHALPIYDGSGGTNVANFAASAAVNTEIANPRSIRCSSGIFVDPDDAATGKIIIAYRLYHDGVAA